MLSIKDVYKKYFFKTSFVFLVWVLLCHDGFAQNLHKVNIK